MAMRRACAGSSSPRPTTRWCSTPRAARSNTPTGTGASPPAPGSAGPSPPVADRQPKPQLLCHVYTERPIYRPEEPVLIAGMVRRAQAGTLALATGAGEVLITGPRRTGMAPAGHDRRCRRLPRPLRCQDRGDRRLRDHLPTHTGQILRQRHRQEGSLPPPHLRGRACRPRHRAARPVLLRRPSSPASLPVACSPTAPSPGASPSSPMSGARPAATVSCSAPTAASPAREASAPPRY